jgi:hypothetical protein
VYALFCVSNFGCEFGLCGIVMVSFSAVWQRLLLLFVGVVGGGLVTISIISVLYVSFSSSWDSVCSVLVR